MPSAPSLAGHIVLHPGRAVPNIVRTRPSALPALLRGRTAASLPGMLSALFTLCGAAHSLTSRRAIAAAQGHDEPMSTADGLTLRAHTAREHVRCMMIDWPARLAAEPVATSPHQLDLLRRCPLLQPGKPAAAALQAMPGWLEVALLGRPAAEWQIAWQGHGDAALAGWCEQGPTPLARLLHQARATAPSLRLPLHALQLPRDEAAQRALAHSLATDPGFVDAPALSAGSAETGAWTRAADAAASGAVPTAWHRLASRLVDLVSLCSAEGGQRLASGVMAAGPQQALAWTETARGLLVHWLHLEGRGADARVHDCRVLAPTDWNFHPAGALAQALARQPDDDAGHAATHLLLAAFDPCVEAQCHWPTEALHA
jgi:hypothetical protein